MTPILGGAVAAYIALKAVGKINALFGSAKAIWGVFAAVLANTGATGAQATAATTAAVASTALMVAQAELAVAAATASGSEVALTAATTAQTAATAAAATSTEALNVALISNPIGLVIALVAGLVIGFIMLWKKFEGFRNFWKKTWNLLVDGAQIALQGFIDYYLTFINLAIDGVNLLIKAWNLISWGEDVKTLKDINFELDLSAAKINTAATNAYSLADGLLVAKAAAEGTYESSQSMAKEMASLKGTLSLGNASAVAGKGKGKGKGTGGGGGGVEKVTKKIKDLITATNKLGTDSVQKAQKFFDTMNDKANEFASTIKNGIMGIWSFTDAMSKSVSSQEAFKTAQDNVATAAQAVNDAIASRDISAYTKAVTDYTKAVDGLNTATTNKISFMDALKKQYEDAKAFSQLLKTLADKGLGPAGVAQVAAAGYEAGTAIGNEIINGGQAAVDNANTWYTELTALSDETSTALKDQFYQAGLDAGQKLVIGLTEAASKLQLKLSSKGITEKQIARLKKNFGVDVDFTMGGLTDLASATPMANGGVVRARSGGTLALLGEAGRDEAVIPLGKSGLGSGGNTYSITINTGVGDKHEIGRELISILQAHEKRNGRLPIRTM